LLIGFRIGFRVTVIVCHGVALESIYDKPELIVARELVYPDMVMTC